MKAFFFIAGVVMGGLFFNAKFTEAAPTVKGATVEVVYGHRVGPDGQVQLITRR